MWTELDDVTTTIFNRQIYIYMYVFHVNYKKMKNYNATNLLQKNKYKKCTKHHYYWFENFSYIAKHCYYWFENFTYATHYYWFEDFTYYMRTFYKYKLKANTCTISPNYNTPVCAHNPTSKASAKNTNTTQSTTTITEINNK